MAKKVDAGGIILTVKVKVDVSWGTTLKMRLMGRYPAAIIARAIAEKIRQA